MVKKLKFEYASHFAKESNFRWNKLVTMWTPIRKHRRGRPMTRWIDEIGEVAGPCWVICARNRSTWSELLKAYIHQWAN